MLREEIEKYMKGLKKDIERLNRRDKNIVKNLLDISYANLLKEIVDDLEKILEG